MRKLKNYEPTKFKVKTSYYDKDAADFAVADHVIDQKTLAERSTTIGDAMADELGVYSNQYGSGSSRPVIRGQDGPRVKVLQHASETADVSTLSPDHAITVEIGMGNRLIQNRQAIAHRTFRRASN